MVLTDVISYNGSFWNRTLWEIMLKAFAMSTYNTT
jgi:hypothetical protein